MSVSAYVPTFNNESTVVEAIESVLAQGVSRADLLVIDDGSTDSSVQRARTTGVEVLVNPRNMGRGYTRARAMEAARHEFVLSCDATKVLGKGFLELATPWFSDPKVAAVFGRYRRLSWHGPVDRWESRHVFCEAAPGNVVHQASLGTGAVLMRRSVVLSLGNFNQALRHSEDAEMGGRLRGGGWDVVYDPQLETFHRLPTAFWPLMERYWRWNVGLGNRVSWLGYLRTISYSIKVLARRDAKARDPWSIPISLFVPHYQFWRTFCLNLSGRNKSVQ